MSAALLYRSPGGLRSVVTLEPRKLGRRRRVRLGVSARDVLKLSPDKHDARSKLAKPLAVLNGTDRVGRPRALSDAELEIVVSLRAADPVTWSWRKLAARLNEERVPEKEVSYVTVKRAFEYTVALSAGRVARIASRRVTATRSRTGPRSRAGRAGVHRHPPIAHSRRERSRRTWSSCGPQTCHRWRKPTSST